MADDGLRQTYDVQGVAVRQYLPPGETGRAPVVMVHGGAHGDWLWDNLATELSGHGWECHVLSWYNHGESRQLPVSEFVGRGIADVADQEIRHVVGGLGVEPILIGHSMGGLASLVYAERAPVRCLVLLTPVMPECVRPDPVPLPVDLDTPFGPFPYELAKQLFFTTLAPELAHDYHQLLVAESPQAVFEATRWTVPVELSAIRVPTCVYAAELDALTPAPAVQRLAQLMGAQYRLVAGIGHSDILLRQPQWRTVADELRQWLTQHG